MSRIQIVLIIVIALMLMRVWLRYRSGVIVKSQFLWWAALWISGGLVVVKPETVNRLADALGVGRGADVVIYGTIVLLFFLNFKLFSKLVKIENDIIKIVRELALKSQDDKRETE